MAFIKTIPSEIACGEVREMYARQQAHWGYVPDYARLFCYRPELMERWGRLLAEAKRPIDEFRYELVTLAAALELRHSACSLAHGRRLAELVGDDKVIAIATGKATDVLSPTEFAIFDFAREVARNASKITQGRVAALREIHGLSEEEIFDIAAIAAARCFFSKLLDALGSEPDVGFMAMKAELRQALAVGRPISHRKAERMDDGIEREMAEVA